MYPEDDRMPIKMGLLILSNVGSDAEDPTRAPAAAAVHMPAPSSATAPPPIEIMRRPPEQPLSLEASDTALANAAPLPRPPLLPLAPPIPPPLVLPRPPRRTAPSPLSLSRMVAAAIVLSTTPRCERRCCRCSCCCMPLCLESRRRDPALLSPFAAGATGGRPLVDGQPGAGRQPEEAGGKLPEEGAAKLLEESGGKLLMRSLPLPLPPQGVAADASRLATLLLARRQIPAAGKGCGEGLISSSWELTDGSEGTPVRGPTGGPKGGSGVGDGCRQRLTIAPAGCGVGTELRDRAGANIGGSLRGAADVAPWLSRGRGLVAAFKAAVILEDTGVKGLPKGRGGSSQVLLGG